MCGQSVVATGMEGNATTTTTTTPPSYCLTTRSSSTDRPRTVTQSATIHKWPQAFHPTHYMHSLLLTSTCLVLFHLIHLPRVSLSSSSFTSPHPPTRFFVLLHHPPSLPRSPPPPTIRSRPPKEVLCFTT